jgi:hypothetical protein
MKVKWGALAVAGSGKINGFVASKNRGGSYFRTKTTPSNPQSIRQQVARAILASLSTAWAGLTENQRLSWSGAVSNFATTDIFGDLRNPSGINLFVKLNTNCINGNFPQLVAAPDKVAVPFDEINQCEIESNGLSSFVEFNTPVLDGMTVFVSATPPLSQGVKFVKNKLRLLGAFEVNGATVDLAGAYGTRFGSLSIGSNVVISVRVVLSNGQTGVAQTYKANVVA